MQIFVVDAFTDVAFRGNPAGVVLLDAPADATWMQDVAAELKHSETAFVLDEHDGTFGRPSRRARSRHRPGWWRRSGSSSCWVLGNGIDVSDERAEERAVAGLTPDLGALAACSVCVTARADAGSGRDFVSRFFAPQSGVAKDPVTGSAHCALAPLWSARLHRTALRAEQLSHRRGLLVVVVDGGDRVHLRGHAITVLAGQLLV